MDQWKSTLERSVYRLQGVAGTLDIIAANNDITNGKPRVGEMFALLSHTVGEVYKELWQLLDPEQEEENDAD